MANYEQLGSQLPQGALFTCAVLYGATALAAPTVQELCVAPFNCRVVGVDAVINTAVVGGDTAIEIKIQGGAAIGTLQTGAGTKGLVDTFDAVVTDTIDAGEVLTATSDGTATTGDVLLLVTLQRVVS